MATQLTIAETVTDIRGALQNYIEATYHIGDRDVVDQRRSLLEQEGVLFRAPYIESTPRYTTAQCFADLEIPDPARSLLCDLAHPPGDQSPLLHDPRTRTRQLLSKRPLATA